MPSVAVKHSFISNVTYNTAGLLVEFKSGDRFRYFGVPKDITIKFFNIEKKGSYYTEYIKGKYTAKKLEKHQA